MNVTKVIDPDTMYEKPREWRDAGFRQLAVWWYDGGEFIGPRHALGSPFELQCGDYVQLDVDHFEVWPHYAPSRLRGEPYDSLPRGRVMFNAKVFKFVVVGPERLVGDEVFRSELRAEYGLPNTTMFESDEHYG